MSLNNLLGIISTNTEEVYLENIDVLNEPIIHIQNVLKGIEMDIQAIHSVLFRYSQSIQDKRFNEVVTNTQSNCLRLNEAAEILYAVQKEIAALHQKIANYQEETANIVPFYKIEFFFPNIDVDPTKVIFNKKDMMQVWHSIGVFNGNNRERSNTLCTIPDNIPGWRDPQKEAFRKILEETSDRLKQIIFELQDYRDHLGIVISHL